MKKLSTLFTNSYHIPLAMGGLTNLMAKGFSFPRANLNWKKLEFSYTKTDFNIRHTYANGKWSLGEVFPHDIMVLSIAAQVLHYGQAVFEGLKVFETKKGEVVSFRPIENAKRLNASLSAVWMPKVPKEYFMKSLDKLVELNKRFIPPYGTGSSFYVRPFVVGTQPLLGVRPATEYEFIMYGSPVGPYFKAGFKPSKMIILEAAPLGVGFAKVAGNYAAGLRGTMQAKNSGYSECIYLDAKEKKYFDESGAANFLIFKKDGTLVTPKSDSILPSITNRSVLEIAEKEFGFKVERRPVSIDEIDDFEECCAVGTAAVISPIGLIHYKGKDYSFGGMDKAGPKLTALYEHLRGIQLGEIEDKYGWLHKIKVN